MSCTKATIKKKYKDELELTSIEARKSLETLLEIMKSSLESGEEIAISGFGKFQVKEKSIQERTESATGEKMLLETSELIHLAARG